MLNIEVLSPSEAQKFLDMVQPGQREIHAMALPLGIEIRGHVNIKCRDVVTGKLAWEFDKDNLITDLGRRGWFDYSLQSEWFCMSANSETPDYRRHSAPGPYGTNDVFGSTGATAASNNSGTNTKTWSLTVAVPASDRTVAAFFLGQRHARSGVKDVRAWVQINPPKTQLTTQTLEVVYKLTMNPIA